MYLVRKKHSGTLLVWSSNMIKMWFWWEKVDKWESVGFNTWRLDFRSPCLLFCLQGFAWPNGSQATTPWRRTTTTMDPLILASFRLIIAGGAMTKSCLSEMDAKSIARVSDEPGLVVIWMIPRFKFGSWHEGLLELHPSKEPKDLHKKHYYWENHIFYQLLCKGYTGPAH